MATMQDTGRSTRQNLSHISLGNKQRNRTVANQKEQAQLRRAIALLRDAEVTNTEVHFKYNCSQAYRMLFALLKERM
jgi:hypothetical protein